MGMTKKHYEGIAAALVEAQAGDKILDTIAAFCKADNPAFDAARFKSVARIDDQSPEGERRATLRQMADDQHGTEGGLEIDGDAAVSEGDDNGAYVAAWLWVDFAGTPFCKDADCADDDCKKHGQEGAARLCPQCGEEMDAHDMRQVNAGGTVGVCPAQGVR